MGRVHAGARLPDTARLERACRTPRAARARLAVTRAQLHPWFRLGLPLDLDLDMYNQHYLDLSRETGGAADRIRAVIREAVHSPRAPPEPAHAQVGRPDAPPSWAPPPGT